MNVVLYGGIILLAVIIFICMSFMFKYIGGFTIKIINKVSNNIIDEKEKNINEK